MRYTYISGFTYWLALGSITVFSVIDGCTNEDPVPFDCDLSDLAIEVSSLENPSNCQSSDGSITVIAAGGKAPYQYGLNGGAYVDSPSFTNLQAGEIILSVKDANGCTRDLSVILGSLQADLDLTPSGCETANGAIAVSPKGGQGPYGFSLDNGATQSAAVFEHVSSGKHNVNITDDTGCSLSLQVRVNTGISYSDQIRPIMVMHCIKSGCHNGDNGGSRNWNSFENVHSHADMIKEFTSTRFMPPEGEPDLTSEEISLIGCWVDDGAIQN